MEQYEIGMLVRSRTGHDHGKVYVIMDMQGEYLFLVDGKIRVLSNPKKKKTKHVQRINTVLNDLMIKRDNQTLIDEDIKRAIKLHETDK